jgi:glycerol-3-phosphate O-acyltransferase / dihydroxyacetone phosphate acyltransferase
VYALVHLIARLYVHGYYRVRVTGEPFPPAGPLLVCANHTAGLMDVGVLLQSAPWPLRFLAKYTLFSSPVVGPLARGGRAIPVYRKKDKVPTEQNLASFEAVYAALHEGGAVAVFPEGESGTSPRLRPPLKTGIARMALGAMDHPNAGDTDVHILPVGIYYEDRDRLRSRLELRVGAPFPVAQHLPAFRDNPRLAVPRLMAQVEAALRAVGPNLLHDGDLPVVKLAQGAWHRADGSHLVLLGRLTAKLNRERATQPEACDERARRAASLLDSCRAAGLTPEEACHRPKGTPLARPGPGALEQARLVEGSEVASEGGSPNANVPRDPVPALTQPVQPNGFLEFVHVGPSCGHLRVLCD